MEPLKTLGNSILEMQKRDPTLSSVKFKDKGDWKSKNWPEYYNDVEKTGAALLALEVAPSDRVALIATTSYLWSVCDLAILGIKAITVPIYPNITPDEIEYILNDCGAKVLICESDTVLKSLKGLQDRCPNIKNCVVFQTQTEVPATLSWAEFQKRGTEFHKKYPTKFQEICSSLLPTDNATILYTSGTTGKPKGVLLTHTQIISEVSEAFSLCGVTENDTSLSFLPYSHVMGRIEHWGHVFIGFTMAYAENIDKIRDNLREIQPTILVSVPRIFEKIYAAIFAQVQIKPMKLKIFNWAIEVGNEVSRLKMSGQILPLDLIVKYTLAQKLVFHKIKDAFGGRLRFAISGGAPISGEIALFFHAAGVLILEGYGLSETTAAITVNTPFNYRFGSVGRPIGEVQIKIAEDGEILVKSKKVMKEYYNNPEATAEAFTGEWFHTGDIGEILLSGDLKITDRKKDLIKTAGGKYVAPQRLEGLLKLNPFISHALIHGDKKKFIVALVTLNQSTVEEHARLHNIPFANWESLAASQYTENLIRDAVASANSQLASFESIKKFKILPVEFTVEGGELTPSMKIKRKLLDQRYQSTIEELYK